MQTEEHVRPVPPVVLSHEQYQQITEGCTVDVDAYHARFKDRVKWVYPDVSSGIAEVVLTNDNDDGFHRITLIAVRQTN
ncbi:MAG: hypothetical protein ABL899_00310 [Nitrospira sp.]